MNTKFLLGLVLAAVGIVLLVMGINATHAVSERVSDTFTGHYSDKTTWYIIGGAACIVLGAGSAFLGLRKSK